MSSQRQPLTPEIGPQACHLGIKLTVSGPSCFSRSPPFSKPFGRCFARSPSSTPLPHALATLSLPVRIPFTLQGLCLPTSSATPWGLSPPALCPVLAHLPLGTCPMLASSQGGPMPLNRPRGLSEPFLWSASSGLWMDGDGIEFARVKFSCPASPSHAHVCTHVCRLAHLPILWLHWPSL